VSVKIPEFGYTDSKGRFYCNKPGRPRKGEFRECVGCGREIYVRPYRLKDPRRLCFCRECTNKLFQPPIKLKGGERRKAGFRCPKCGSSHIYKIEDGFQCFICSKIIYITQQKRIRYSR